MYVYGAMLGNGPSFIFCRYLLCWVKSAMIDYHRVLRQAHGEPKEEGGYAENMFLFDEKMMAKSRWFSFKSVRVSKMHET